jgi:hypothetical protein
MTEIITDYLDAKQLADRLTALELRSTSELARLEQERDEAREDADHWKIEYEIVVSRLCGVKHDRDNGVIFEHEIIPKLQRERDEARDAIIGWENKWKCAVDMAARAELERDEALKCAKEYYVEFIRNASSDNKVSKPNPLNPFYKY